MPSKPSRTVVFAADAESKLSPADRARRAFDVRLVASILDLFRTTGETSDDDRLPSLAADSLRWVVDALEPLARSARIGRRADYILNTASISAKDVAEAEVVWHGFFNLWFGTQARGPVGRRLVTLRPHRVGEPLKFKAGRDWIDEQLGQVWSVDHWRVGETGVERVAIPTLGTVRRCAAYVVAVVMENRWGLGERVKVCPYRSDPQEGFHVFLDYRLQDDGSLETGRPQEFCCKAHADAEKSRRYRARKRRRESREAQ